MPANAAHYLFAKKLVPELEQFYPALDTRALYYGTQGPDVLFFHRVLPWMPGKSLHRCGSLLHKIDPAVTFQVLADYLKNSPSYPEIARSYIYGFILHYCLDRRAHVYINATVQAIMAKEGIRYSASIIHNRIETNLDTILIRDMLNMDGNLFHPWENFSDDPAVLEGIADILVFLLKQALHQETTREQMIFALKDTSKMLRLLTDASGKKTAALGIAEKLLPHHTPAATSLIRGKESDGKWDYANMSHSAWTPSGDKNSVQTDSFYDMIEQAAQDGLAMIKAFTLALSDSRPMRIVTGSYNFSGTLSNP